MRNLKSSAKRDKEILSHVRWASRQIPRISKKIFEDIYSDQFPNAKDIAEAIPDKGAHKSFTASPRLIEPFTKYGITSNINLMISVEEEGCIEELKDYSGILFHIYFGDGLPTYGALIQPRPLRDKESALDRRTGRKIRPDGWRKREWDGLTRILYYRHDPHQYKPIDLFLQIGIDLIQREFLTGLDCILKEFRKYAFDRFFPENKIPILAPDVKKQLKFMSGNEREAAIKIYSKLEKEGLGEISNDSLISEIEDEDNDKHDPGKGKIISVQEQDGEGNVYRRSFRLSVKPRHKTYQINSQDITENILKESLNHIVKRISFPCLYNPTTFGVYFYWVLTWKIRDHHRQIMGTPKRQNYQSKSNSERDRKKEIRKLLCKGWTIKEVRNQAGFHELKKIDTAKNVKEETARKRLQRWLKKWDINDIEQALF